MRATTARCLKVMRDLDREDRPITSQSLMDALEIEGTERSTAMDIAAGWISTLRRYGFLLVSVGEKVAGPSRQVQVYRLTDWGRRYKAEGKVPLTRREIAQPAKDLLRIAANPGKKK